MGEGGARLVAFMRKVLLYRHPRRVWVAEVGNHGMELRQSVLDRESRALEVNQALNYCDRF